MRTQLYINDSLCDLEGDEVIAASYSIAPISDISKRTSFASISFNLPMTNNNREIFESAEVIVNGSVIPYTILKARLYVDGIDQLIRQAELVSVKDSYRIKTYGGNIDFFSLIKDKKLSDLGNQWDHLFTVPNIEASLPNTSGYIYAFADYFSDSPNTYIDNIAESIAAEGMLPSVYLHSLISKIIEDAGYTANGDFLSNADYKSVIVPCTEEYETIAFTSTDTISVVLGLTFRYAGVLATVDGLVYKAGSRITFQNTLIPTEILIAETTEDFPVVANVKLFLVYGNIIQINGISEVGGGLFGFTAGQSYTVTMESIVENTTGQNINAVIGVTTSLPAVFTITEPLFTGDIGNRYGALLNIAGKLPDLKQSDLLKDTAQKFNLIFQADDINKILYVKQFSEIVANTANALDWTDKVDYSEKHEVRFDSDYGQINTCRYKDDESVVKPDGTDSEILISNKTLPNEKKLFESPFAASEQVQRFGGFSIAHIKLYTDLGGADEEINNIQPRYLKVYRQAFSVFGITLVGFPVAFPGGDIPFTSFIIPSDSFNLGFENNLLDNSIDFIESIQQYKQVTIPMRLTPADINQLDFFKPVWITLRGQPGAHFYISEIKQFKFTSVESTDVEFVKLT